MLTVPETTEDDRIVAKCYVELGNVTKEKGEYDESLRYHRKSMEIFERIDDPHSVADSHLNIAEIYKVKGELKQAMSEYEKGLSLYEDIYVEDANKNSDSGTDISLNSSSFSDLQHTRSLSKSDETLPQTMLIDVTEKDVTLPSSSHLLNGMINTSSSSLDLLVSSTKKTHEFEDILRSTTSIDESPVISSEKMAIERSKSLSSSRASDLQYPNDNDILFPSSSPNLADKTTIEMALEENDIFDICTSCLSPSDVTKQELPLLTTDPLLFNTKSKEATNNNIASIYRWWHCLSNKHFLVLIVSVFFIGALFGSLSNTSIESLLKCSPSDFSMHKNTHTSNHDDLNEQLRKILTWRKDRIASLNNDMRRMIHEFLANSGSQTKITVDKFQRILDLLDLKIVLIPR